MLHVYDGSGEVVLHVYGGSLEVTLHIYGGSCAQYMPVLAIDMCIMRYGFMSVSFSLITDST